MLFEQFINVCYLAGFGILVDILSSVFLYVWCVQSVNFSETFVAHKEKKLLEYFAPA